MVQTTYLAPIIATLFLGLQASALPPNPPAHNAPPPNHAANTPATHPSSDAALAPTSTGGSFSTVPSASLNYTATPTVFSDMNSAQLMSFYSAYTSSVMSDASATMSSVSANAVNSCNGQWYHVSAYMANLTTTAGGPSALTTATSV